MDVLLQVSAQANLSAAGSEIGPKRIVDGLFGRPR
jgi:hypothetical protein